MKTASSELQVSLPRIARASVLCNHLATAPRKHQISSSPNTKADVLESTTLEKSQFSIPLILLSRIDSVGFWPGGHLVPSRLNQSYRP
ncbi:hypothetical protein PHBOTO_003426 [Pseudozyma hubeiensis]|nr:hypothetical protein PHBOTO_003426 [Pseudozyma hubeiensis]